MSVITIGKKITVPAGNTVTETLYQVKTAQRLIIDEITVVGPTGVDGQVELVIKRGDYNAIPNRGSIYVLPVPITLSVYEVYDSGSNVDAVLTNNDTTNDHEVYVYLTGEIE